MAAGAEGGGGDTASFPSTWQKIEKRIDKVEEEMGNLQILLQDFKKDLNTTLCDFKAGWREMMAEIREISSNEVLGEGQQLMESAEPPKMKRKDHKMTPAEGKESKKRKTTQQGTLLNFGLSLTKKEIKREEPAKRKRSPEGQTGLEQKNTMRNNVKKKKIQEEFYDKKKKETKEAG